MSMADVALKKGDLKNATLMYTKATNSMENYYDGDVMKRIDCKRREALFFFETGQNDKAYSTFKNIMSLLENSPNIDQPGLASCYEDVGNVLLKIGDYSMALQYYQKSLVLREKYYCDGHPEVIKLLQILGEQYSKHDKCRAIEYYKKLIEQYQKIYGIDYYPNDRNLLETIGLLYFDNRQYGKALEYFAKLAEIGQKVEEIEKLPAVLLKNKNLNESSMGEIQDCMIEEMKKIAT